jgi:hypothetical protein
MERKTKGDSTDERMVTEEMIAAAAAVLWENPFLEMGQTGAEILAEEMLRQALSASRKKTYATSMKAHPLRKDVPADR